MANYIVQNLLNRNSVSTQRSGVMAKRQRHVCQTIPCSQYAKWRAANKPPRINERRVKRLKNRQWRKFARARNVNERVRVHDHESRSYREWATFQRWWNDYKTEVIQANV